MRRSIPIKATRRGTEEPQTRLFWMSDAQAELFETVALKLAKATDASPEHAAGMVEKAVCSMMGGKNPQEQAHKVFHDLRRAFPILQSRYVRRLPIAGCPEGEIEAVVREIKSEERPDDELFNRAILYGFDFDQVCWHRDALELFAFRDGMSRDDGWHLANTVIDKLIGGGVLKEDSDELILMRAVNLFPALTEDDVRAIPTATEEDVRRWCYRAGTDED